MTADVLATAEDAAVTVDLKDPAESLRASLGISKPTDEERARREVRWKAQRTGETCGQCGCALEPDEAVWRTRIGIGRSIFGGWSWTIVPLCRECKRDWPGYGAVEPCEACGRPVTNESTEQDRDYRLRDELARAKFYNLPLPMGKERPTRRFSKKKPTHWFCSERCAKWCYRAKDREQRAEQRLKDCAVCGEPFEAARSDAKTCSPACRQKAYRRRAGDTPRIRNASVGDAVAALVNVTGDAGGAAPGRAP